MNLKKRLPLTLLFLGLLMLVAACGTPAHANSNTSTASTSSTSTPTATPVPATPTATPVPATPTATPAQKHQNWKTYHGMGFTIQYPANWLVTILPQGPDSAMFVQQVEFRPSAISSISFIVGVLYNGEMTPDSLLKNDLLYKSCKIDSTSKVTAGGILWSTALIETQGKQLAPAKIKLAYANHHHPYRIEFSTSPARFAANYATLNTIFHSFQES